MQISDMSRSRSVHALCTSALKLTQYAYRAEAVLVFSCSRLLMLASSHARVFSCSRLLMLASSHARVFSCSRLLMLSSRARQKPAACVACMCASHAPVHEHLDLLRRVAPRRTAKYSLSRTCAVMHVCVAECKRMYSRKCTCMHACICTHMYT
jgi:hypothetical protein